MTITLFFDTETTGIWQNGLDPLNPNQPHMVQLGAVLRDAHGKIYAELDTIVFPEIDIPSDAARIHGITTEIADRFGVSRKNACLLFNDMVSLADRVVAHNLDFDKKIMKRAFLLESLNIDPFDKKEEICTMLSAIDVCRIPFKNGFRKSGFKWPSLNEAHMYFTNTPVENAHNAMVDVKACINVYDGLKALGIIK